MLRHEQIVGKLREALDAMAPAAGYNLGPYAVGRVDLDTELTYESSHGDPQAIVRPGAETAVRRAGGGRHNATAEFFIHAATRTAGESKSPFSEATVIGTIQNQLLEDVSKAILTSSWATWGLEVTGMTITDRDREVFWQGWVSVTMRFDLEYVFSGATP